MRLLAPDRMDAAQPLEEIWVVESLPPFPAVAVRALNRMAGTDTSLRDLCDLIRTDPAFSADVLRLANSPLIGFPKQITSILQASMLLGFNRLKSVVITIGLKAYVEDAFTPFLKPAGAIALLARSLPSAPPRQPSRIEILLTLRAFCTL